MVSWVLDSRCAELKRSFFTLGERPDHGTVVGRCFRDTLQMVAHYSIRNCISYRVCDSTQAENRQGNCLTSGGSWQVIKILNIFQPNLTTIWKTDQHCNCTLPENHVELTMNHEESCNLLGNHLTRL